MEINTNGEEISAKVHVGIIFGLFHNYHSRCRSAEVKPGGINKLVIGTSFDNTTILRGVLLKKVLEAGASRQDTSAGAVDVNEFIDFIESSRQSGIDEVVLFPLWK